MPTLLAASDFTEAAWINRSFRATQSGAVDTPPSALYAFLATADPTDTGAGAGTVSAGAVTAWAAAAAAQSVTNAVTNFGTPAAQTWTHIALRDASSWGSGNLRYAGLLDAPVITDGSTPLTIPAGDLKINMARTSGRGFTDYLANKNLDHDLRSVTYAGPNVVEVVITDDTGALFSNGAQPLVFGAPAVDGTGMKASNTNSGSFTFTAGTVGGFRYREQGGQDMAVGTFSSPREVADGATATFAAGQFTVRVA